jgi:hypothetical protein
MVCPLNVVLTIASMGFGNARYKIHNFPRSITSDCFIWHALSLLLQACSWVNLVRFT